MDLGFEAERIDVVKNMAPFDEGPIWEARIVVHFRSEEEADGFAEEFMLRGMLGMLDFDIPKIH